MTQIDRLVDQLRDLETLAAAKRLELAIAQGDIAAVAATQRAIDALAVQQRWDALDRAERAGGCFFAAAGAIDGEAARG